MGVSGDVPHACFPKLPEELEIRSGDGGDIEEGLFLLPGFREPREDAGVVAENLLIIPKCVFDELVETWWGND